MHVLLLYYYELKKELEKKRADSCNEDIEKAVKEAAEYEAQDKKRKEAVDARNDADAMVFQTEKALGEVANEYLKQLKGKIKEKLGIKNFPPNMIPVSVLDAILGSELGVEPFYSFLFV